MPLQTISRWPSVHGKMIGAEQPVKEREMDGEIDVNGFLIDGMMPVMKTRRDEKLFKFGKAPVKVRVNESGVQVNNEDIRIHGTGTEAQDEHRNDRGATEGQNLKEMHPGPGHPVHAACRMMDRVESP